MPVCWGCQADEMPFHFTLQAVLRLRASFVQMEKLRLLAIAAAVARVRDEIVALEKDTRAARQSTQSRLGEGVMAGELHFELSTERMRVERKRALAVRLADLEKKQAVQREAYRAARQKHEILVNLRQRQWNEYRHAQARREQQQQDEAFLLHLAVGSEDKAD